MTCCKEKVAFRFFPALNLFLIHVYFVRPLGYMQRKQFNWQSYAFFNNK